MKNQSELTKQKIVEISRQLFLSLDFNNVSMRRIAKDASLTTGALYNHFKSKDDLFEYIVGDSARGLLDLFEKAHSFEEGSLLKEYRWMEEEINSKTLIILDYVYDNFQDMKIIFTKSRGSKYENYIYDLVRVENTMSKNFYQDQELDFIDEFFLHVLSTMGVRNFLEIIYHDLSREEAIEYMNKLQHFYRYGYMGIVDGLSVEEEEFNEE